MPALKAVLKSLDGLQDPLKEFYKKDGEEYHLDVDELVPKAKLDEFRTNNRELVRELTETKEALKQFDGVDLKQWKTLQETAQKVKDGELIKAGKIDELLQSKLDPILKKHADTEAASLKDKERLSAQLSKVMIDQELTKLASAKGLRPEAIPDMLGRLRGEFSVVGDKVVSLDGEGTMRRTDGGEPYTLEKSIEGLAKTAPHLFHSSNGSGAPPNNGTGGGGGGRQITRQEFHKLDPVAQMNTAREAKEGKVKIVDAA